MSISLRAIAVAGCLAWTGVAVLLLAGCATGPKLESARDVAGAVQTLDTEFDTTRAHVAPEVSGTVGGFGGPMYSARLAAVQDKRTGVVTHALVVNWTYVASAWEFFASPTLPGGHVCPMSIGARTVVHCSGAWCTHKESTTVQFPPGALLPGVPLRIRFSSTSGFRTIELPSEYVAGFLQGVATAVGSAKTGLVPQAAIEPRKGPAETGASRNASTRPLQLGRDGWQADKAVRQAGCGSKAQASMTASGPGFEVYNATCIGGDVMTVRCEMGHCKVLQ